MELNEEQAGVLKTGTNKGYRLAACAAFHCLFLDAIRLSRDRGVNTVCLEAHFSHIA